jgi:hypothetical protein
MGNHGMRRWQHDGIAHARRPGSRAAHGFAVGPRSPKPPEQIPGPIPRDQAERDRRPQRPGLSIATSVPRVWAGGPRPTASRTKLPNRSAISPPSAAPARRPSRRSGSVRLGKGLGARGEPFEMIHEMSGPRRPDRFGMASARDQVERNRGRANARKRPARSAPTP